MFMVNSQFVAPKTITPMGQGLKEGQINQQLKASTMPQPNHEKEQKIYHSQPPFFNGSSPYTPQGQTNIRNTLNHPGSSTPTFNMIKTGPGPIVVRKL